MRGVDTSYSRFPVNGALRQVDKRGKGHYNEGCKLTGQWTVLTSGNGGPQAVSAEPGGPAREKVRMFSMEQTTRAPRREESLAKTRTLTKMALCVALLAISAYISFPLPFTPAMVTALTIVVNLTAFILKPKEAFLAVLAWMILGAVGVPVFVGGTAGLGKLVGPTGGFVVSFVVAAWLMSKLRGNATSFKTLACLGIFVGMPVIYIGGCFSMYLVAHLSVWATLVAAVFPFLFGDVVKVLIAAFLATHIHKMLKD